jgi:hypothetical protein
VINRDPELKAGLKNPISKSYPVGTSAVGEIVWRKTPPPPLGKSGILSPRLASAVAPWARRVGTAWARAGVRMESTLISVGPNGGVELVPRANPQPTGLGKHAF